MPHIISELDNLFDEGGGHADLTFEQLELLAKVGYQRYMCSAAYTAALGKVTRSADIYGESGVPVTGNQAGEENEGWSGDRQLANLILRMRDTFWYYEYCHAIVDGDVGRVVEVIKVSLSLNTLMHAKLMFV